MHLHPCPLADLVAPSSSLLRPLPLVRLPCPPPENDRETRTLPALAHLDLSAASIPIFTLGGLGWHTSLLQGAPGTCWLGTVSLHYPRAALHFFCISQFPSSLLPCFAFILSPFLIAVSPQSSFKLLFAGGAGNLGVPLGGTRRVGGLLGVAGRLSGPLRPSGRNRGLPLRRRRGQGPHLAKRWEPRGFSRVAAAFSSYGGDLSLPLGLALGSPIFPSGCPD